MLPVAIFTGRNNAVNTTNQKNRPFLPFIIVIFVVDLLLCESSIKKKFY